MGNNVKSPKLSSRANNAYGGKGKANTNIPAGKPSTKDMVSMDNMTKTPPAPKAKSA